MQMYAEDSLTEATIRSNRRKLAVLLIIPLVVLATAYAVFYTGFGVPTGTTNKGELIQPPIATEDFVYNKLDGSLYTPESLWHMVIPVLGDCSAACRDTLYTTRQVHLRQGKRAIDIDRIAVLTRPPTAEFVAFMEAEHPRTALVLANQAQWALVSEPTQLADGDYFLVDPRGWLMMAYRSEHTGEDLLFDLKKLVR